MSLIRLTIICALSLTISSCKQTQQSPLSESNSPSLLQFLPSDTVGYALISDWQGGYKRYKHSQFYSSSLTSTRALTNQYGTSGDQRLLAVVQMIATRLGLLGTRRSDILVGQLLIFARPGGSIS
jgi:hypothetical protein